MNRRGLLKGAVVMPMGLAASTNAPAQSVSPLLVPTPKTTDELRHAIESIFDVRGQFNMSYIMVGDQKIDFKTYLSGHDIRHNYFAPTISEIDCYWPSIEQAVAATWQKVLMIKDDIRTDWTEEMKEDYGSMPIVKAQIVWWRAYPELIETKNKLYAVRMRAAFT